MPLLIRKIKRAKWPNNPPQTADDLPADSFTCGCLKTQANKLSTWRIADQGQLNRALLAIVMSNTEVETFDIVCLDQTILTDAAITLENTPGVTKIAALRNTHVDVSALNHKTLGILAHHASQQVCANGHVRCRIPKIVELVQAAFAAGEIAPGDLEPEYLEKLKSKGLVVQAA